MRDFKFNEFGICANPEIALEASTSNSRCRVTVAQLPDGRWCHGICLHVGTSGYSYGAGWGANSVYEGQYIADTREGAIRLAVAIVRSRRYCEPLARVMLEELNALVEREQPTLFELGA